MHTKYYLTNENEFVIEDYDKVMTFASFLPGIAGTDGIPMWAFYVNRGQGMASFGVKDKNNTIMEFSPAITLYKNIELQGFRTFIKHKNSIHEIFSSTTVDKVKRMMTIGKNVLRVEEINHTLGLKVKVTYFTMPKENFAALVRKLEITNLDNEAKYIEILDGLTQIIPFGVGNGVFREMANLFRAWFDVTNIENGIAYYKTRATTSDTSEVGEVNRGNFYLSFTSESNGLIAPIYDLEVIFGSNTSLTLPDGWDGTVMELRSRKQVAVNKIPCGFTATDTLLEESFVLCTVIGHIADEKLINKRKNAFTLSYIENKEIEAIKLADDLVEDVATHTAYETFDKYIEQCYLDNVLRGGLPLLLQSGDVKHIYHVYSRKHGDPEREYNFFSLEPSYYSQGNGNFRDVNQNRRNDILFYPEIKDFNVKQFMSLIQADGYNPLSVKGSTFELDKTALSKILEFVTDDKDILKKLLTGKFTPGTLMNCIADYGIKIRVADQDFLHIVLENSKQNYEAAFGEGYWIDHWTYNMDLIDTYLMVYPDTLETFLFDDDTYRFFDSPVRILNREEKHVIKDGKVRQYGSVMEDESKCHRLGISVNSTNWLRTEHGLGEVFETNLYVKLISLALNKFVTMDPYGMGIEMEAERPGWNDAMNGLPGLFGSGVSETAELNRMVDFIIDVSCKFDREIDIPAEIAELLNTAESILDEYSLGNIDDFNYWDKTSTAREQYRSKIRYGIDGALKRVTTKEIQKAFFKFASKIKKGLNKALQYGKGIYPTYLIFSAKKYEILEGKVNPKNGYQNVKVTEFDCRALPLFLEGPARILKGIQDKSAATVLYQLIKESAIYDRKLKMYKTSEPLDGEGNEIGRIRAFTAGWLERESVFLHMEYKYLLAMLQSGLYKEFFEDIKTALVPFVDPAVYGRSILENSSFIASSVNPDDSVHGRGFVARLSGSTAEVLSMWLLMMVGNKPFNYERGELNLTLSPVLAGDFFDKKGVVSFKFLGKTKVTYHNPDKLNTYGENSATVRRITFKTSDGQYIEVNGNTIGMPYAEEARSGNIQTIHAYLA